ncbi:PucR family transcriptional regulator [Fusibacter tunisiensis]|uniref:Purine catabolism regulator n=1 Tax=Fusibacter tunisiensis TaxID=1008308 RepID=A0ABS2MQL8_9FIRM|nr:PucR family transcriptional regulator [Fusibacter tunisiensis]MBM7561698.1 purine catabolism regulator [Fusibacter tunisiensis]
MQTKMGVRLNEIISLDAFTSSEIIAGHRGMDRPVTKVNVMEVPDIVPWLQSGEFLLTTAYSIKDNIEKLNDLIPKMHEIGVAGLGIKMKRYVEELPKAVIDLSNNLGFPIIGIPVDVSFGDLITSVLTTLVNNQTSLLLQIDGFNNKLKDIMLRGGDLEEISHMISEAMNSPVAITDNLFREFVLCADDSLQSELNGIVEKVLYKRADRFKRNYKDQGIESVVDVIQGEPIERLMIPIFSEEVLYGHVIVWDFNKRVTDKMLFMMEAAVSLIALHSTKKLSVYENENKHKIEFIEELLSAQEGQQIRALEKSNYFDFDKTKAHGVVLVKTIDAPYDMRMTPNNSQVIKQLNSKLVSVVERVQRHFKDKLIYGNKSDRVIFLLSFDPYAPPEENKDQMLKFCEELNHFAKFDHIDQKIFIGVGRIYDTNKTLYKSYQEAERAIHKMELSKGKLESNVLHFDDLGIYRILSNDAIQPELFQFFMEVLGPIALYDQEKDAELIDTLKMYYKCGCNLKRVSEEMFTHYNTIIYRMQRIREIGNIDFSDSDTSLNVHVAIKILDVIQPDILNG